MKDNTIWILFVLILTTYWPQLEAGFDGTLDVGLYTLNATLQVAEVASKAANVAISARG
uniref:Cecropin Psi-1 n=1 Tax=Drosophila melanogaster TaxID=7227 RepID=A2IPN6_DROME|nr:cecropin Psi-1 [Drosophila melanogaster]BAA28741.1 cecropin Psi-1 [Drosophila melanogaster]